VRGMRHVWGREMCIYGYGGEGPSGRDHLEDLSNDRRKIFKRILKRVGGCGLDGSGLG
jgi:hypothetical protein